MLKRANMALLGAAVPGFLAYTGCVDALTAVAKFITLALLGFSAVSFLLSLFEDEDIPPRLAPAVTEGSVARVAP
jgi:hypothetical protein